MVQWTEHKLHYILYILFFFPLSSFAFSIDDIYTHLLKDYPQFKDITYNQPTTDNILIQNDWLYQTPNHWDSDLEVYNKSFLPSHKHKIDKDYYAPTCHTQDDCAGVGTCKKANFTLDDRKLCLTHAHDFLEQMFETITNAQWTVDIVTLGKGTVTTQAFTTVLNNAIQVLSQKSVTQNRRIVIRILQSSYLPFTPYLIKNYLDRIVKNLAPNNQITIGVATAQSCALGFNCGNDNDQTDLSLNFSWNHGKIINIDNQILITGGENFYGEDYLGKNPVNDSNIKIFGKTATGATIYSNQLWNYVRNNQSLFMNYCFTYTNNNTDKTCIENLDPKITYNWTETMLNQDKKYFVKAMYISKLNNSVGLDHQADQSELARVYAIRNAHESVKISQQALFSKHYTHPKSKFEYLHPLHTIDGNIIEAIAHAIHYNHASVYIVTSNLENTGYGSFADSQYLYDCIKNTFHGSFHMNEENVKHELSKHLHLATLGYNQSLVEINNIDKSILKKNRSHNKFWMVDDKLFYFGSHNFYPSSMQEFGVIVESEDAVKNELLPNFWDPMWKSSYKI